MTTSRYSNTGLVRLVTSKNTTWELLATKLMEFLPQKDGGIDPIVFREIEDEVKR